MAIKMTMADGTIIEGTAEELAALQKIAEEDAQDEVKPKFEIGDYVVPTSATRYGYTSKPHMKLGKVVTPTDYERDGDDIRVEIIAIDGDYAGSEGKSFSVNSKYFAKADEATIAKYTKESSGDKPLKEGDLARVVGDTYHGVIAKGRLVEIKRGADFEGDYRIVTADGSRDYAQAESLSKLESDDAIGVGDIVRVTEFRYGFPVGTIGEVFAVLENDRTLVKSVRADSRCRFQERNVELVAKASDRADIDV